MDVPHVALPPSQERVCFTVANLLACEVAVLFFDTTFDLLGGRPPA